MLTHLPRRLIGLNPHRFLLAILLLIVVAPALIAQQESTGDGQPVSFARQVRPILQAACFGCHQGARKNGDYDMTSFEGLLAGGESGLPAIMPGDSDESYLVELISHEEDTADPTAQMPPEGEPLTTEQIDSIRRWIDQGAINDSPPRPTFDQDDPPEYSRLPVITSLAYSPDGRLLATSGLNEVILLDPADESTKARLIGMSPRIESVRFSPDGKFLAVAAGMPGEFGELQVWDTNTYEQVLSKVVTHDTIYGVSWSPDSRTIAFGCADTAVRAVDRESGQQVLYQNAHEDWIRDTTFSTDGSHLVSVGRDMTCKLTEVAEQRFVDNITSITPGVLKGGIAAVAKHPQRDEVLIGGADGVAKVYRMFRLTKRVIGDDANLIRKMPAVEGRIQSVAVSPDGQRIAVGSSLDGRGALHVFSYAFDTSLPNDIKAIMSKVVSQRNAEEKKKIEEYVTRDVQQVSSIQFPSTGIYAVAFDPTGQLLAVGGNDGVIRLIDTESGKAKGEIRPVDVDSSGVSVSVAANWRFNETSAETSGTSEQLTPDELTGLVAKPQQLIFSRPIDYCQLVIQATNVDGKSLDVTSQADVEYDRSLLRVTPEKLVEPLASGKTAIKIRFGDAQVSLPVEVQFPTTQSIDYMRDVAPILSRIGCNAGTCHGSASGKNGFKLSLRGYDPVFDVRALTDDMSSRRVNVASPEESLMLLKPTATVPHAGGQVLERNSKYYSILRQWIADGAPFNADSARVIGLQVSPAAPILWPEHTTQQFNVWANYADGTVRDVTREAFIESADTELARIGKTGVATGLRRGETAVLARYEGAFAAATLTVMGEREGYQWQEPPKFNEIDDFVAAKWKRMQIEPSRLTNDNEFIRRVYLDLTGLPPTAEAVRKFVADQTETQSKRDALVDQLMASEQFVDHWTNKWGDLLQVNRKFLGAEGAASFRAWIRQRVKDNVPYDDFVRQLMTASGSNNENPAASYFKILRTPDAIMENTTHLFLATRFNCNKCHDHPFERWTQDQYYETAAFFARVGLKKDPISEDRTIGGTAVEAAKPLYEIVYETPEGEVKHDRTGQITEPTFPFECDFESADSETRRQQFAGWLTSPDNPYFARSYVNRLWGYLLGRGLIEPIDDIRAGNPPTNPELLRYLTDQFVESGFDTRHILQLICKSRAYQLSVETNRFNADDSINYSHAVPRRLPAEVLFDTIHASVGSQTMIPGYDRGIRAAELPDAGARLPSGFLATLGRPARESVCECDRSNDLQLGSVLALVSGPDVARAINDQDNDLANLVESIENDRDLIDEIYLRLLSRSATDEEIKLSLESFGQIASDHEALIKQRDERAKLVADQLPSLEKQRADAIAEAKMDLDSYLKETDPELPNREKQRADAIAAAETELEEYKKNEDREFLVWRQRQLSRVGWHPIVPSSISQTSGAASELLADRSIRVNENKGKTVTEVIAETDLAGISAIRLEVLADPNLPGGGPGLAENGNFVLTEFQLEIASRALPDDWKPVKLASAISDFDQNTYPITTAIDNNLGGGNGQGWAIVPQTKKSHWATFELQLPVGYAGGTRLRFKLHQNYGFDNKHQIGRFRISLARDTEPVGLSVSEELLTKLVEPPENWTKEQRQQLVAVFQRGDQKLLALQRRLNEAKKPLQIDAGIVARRAKLERVSRPIPKDPKLARLESDVKYSAQQLDNQRLTAAQDLVWALINSPSFLFNR